MDTPKPQQIPVAHLVRPQGRRGELLAEPLSDLPGLFVEGKRFWCVPKAASVVSPRAAFVTLDACWSPTGRNAGRLVLKLAGVDSISAAEQLAGAELLLDELELPPPEPDTFLVRDLLGCTLYDAGKPVGEIVDVEFPMAPDGRTRLGDAASLLLVQLTRLPTSSPEPLSTPVSAQLSLEPPVMVPFVKAWLIEVDLRHRAVHMNLPAGLLGLTDETPPEPQAVP